jgi:hypothetical protein
MIPTAGQFEVEVFSGIFHVDTQPLDIYMLRSNLVLTSNVRKEAGPAMIRMICLGSPCCVKISKCLWFDESRFRVPASEFLHQKLCNTRQEGGAIRRA